jgi:hypothetical protein
VRGLSAVNQKQEARSKNLLGGYSMTRAIQFSFSKKDSPQRTPQVRRGLGDISSNLNISSATLRRPLRLLLSISSEICLVSI